MSGVDAGVRGETTARGADFVFFAGGVFFFVGDDLFRGDDGLALATTVDAVSRRLLPDGVEAGEENGSATAEVDDASVLVFGVARRRLLHRSAKVVSQPLPPRKLELTRRDFLSTLARVLMH